MKSTDKKTSTPSSLSHLLHQPALQGLTSKFNPGYNIILRSQLLGYKQPTSLPRTRLEQHAHFRSAGMPSSSIFSYSTRPAASSATSFDDDSQSHFAPVSTFSAAVPSSMLKTAGDMQRQSLVRCIDAPGLVDDYYLKPLDWSSRGIIAVGLGRTTWLWHPSKWPFHGHAAADARDQVTRLCDVSPSATTSSVAWSRSGNICAVGSSTGCVQLWDVNKLQLLHEYKGHTKTVHSMAWTSKLIATASKDKTIHLLDPRAGKKHIMEPYRSTEPLCSVKWSPDGQHLAGGGYGGTVHIWDLRHSRPLFSLQHKSAVKALAWSPTRRNILASGGGKDDGSIHIWDAATGRELQQVATGSQVCQLLWSKTGDALVTTHGYPLCSSGGEDSGMEGSLCVWSYPALQMAQIQPGIHGIYTDSTSTSVRGLRIFRPLYMAMSPDGQYVVTGSGDETLRFRRVFKSYASDLVGCPLVSTPSHSCWSASLHSQIR